MMRNEDVECNIKGLASGFNKIVVCNLIDDKSVCDIFNYCLNNQANLKASKTLIILPLFSGFTFEEYRKIGGYTFVLIPITSYYSGKDDENWTKYIDKNKQTSLNGVSYLYDRLIGRRFHNGSLGIFEFDVVTNYGNISFDLVAERANIFDISPAPKLLKVKISIDNRRRMLLDLIENTNLPPKHIVLTPQQVAVLIIESIVRLEQSTLSEFDEIWAAFNLNPIANIETVYVQRRNISNSIKELMMDYNNLQAQLENFIESKCKNGQFANLEFIIDNFSLNFINNLTSKLSKTAS